MSYRPAKFSSSFMQGINSCVIIPFEYIFPPKYLALAELVVPPNRDKVFAFDTSTVIDLEMLPTDAFLPNISRVYNLRVKLEAPIKVPLVPEDDENTDAPA